MVSMSTDTLSGLGYEWLVWAEGGTTGAVPHRVPGRLAPVAEELSRFVLLPSGWNSYGAVPTRAEAIEMAMRVLARATEMLPDLPLPSVCPTPGGGIQMEWGGDGDGVEIEIEPDRTMGILWEVNGEVQERRASQLEDPSLSEALYWASKLA